MKILQINSFLSVGGPPRIVNGIYDTLKEQGHECKIAGGREKMYAPEDTYRMGTRIDEYRNAILARLLDNEGRNARSATRELVQWMESYDPDIIHLHNLHGYFINIPILFDYLKRSGKPVVWTLHDCWSMTGHCAHFDRIGCTKWRTQCSHCPLTRAYPNSYGISQTAANYRIKKQSFTGLKNMTIVTPSQWLAGLTRQSYLKEYPVEVIHNGISLEQFRPMQGDFVSKHHLEDKKIVLGVAQNWMQNKGYEDMLLLAQLLGDGYQVVMVGLTQKELEKLPKQILGITRTNSVGELTEIYTAAEVFVNFSYEDTFPTVNIEALACGTPVLTYRTGGCPEALDAESGWVIPQGDVNAAVQIIRTMGSKASRVDACIRRSKAFDRKERYQEYIDLYSRMLGNEENT